MSTASTNSIFDARVLELIRKAILAGDVMPLNGTMARRLKCADSTVTTAMTRLTRSGAVWVQRIGNARVAGILGVGQTADVDPAELNQRVPLSPDDIETRRVDRSTCFRCGVRSDHGCRHIQKDAPSVSAEGISDRRAGSHNSTEFGEGFGGHIRALVKVA